MVHLGLDIGSSSVKAGVLHGRRVVGAIAHASFPTRHAGVRVEVKPDDLLRAVKTAIQQLGPRARKVDVIGLSVMSPAWVAMDKRGKPLTPIVTHQDRRSVEIAQQLEERLGKVRWLQLAGNRPFPGGISATTWAWFLKNERARLSRADLAGHLNTFLHRQITGARVIDRANASFTGFYHVPTQAGWSQELVELVGVIASQLPQVFESNVIAGRVLPEAARTLGLREGTPMMTGIVDTSSAMLLTGSRPGQLLNVSGSTDVLGLCTAKPSPHENLLTRALGVGSKWMSVSTIAAAGSSLNWMKDQLFRDLKPADFWKQVAKCASSDLRQASAAKKAKADPAPGSAAVHFDPYLAGERTSITQRQASFNGLTLASTREQMLGAVISALAQASAARLELLRETRTPIRHDVVLSGGVQSGLARILHSRWPGHWSFRGEPEATLRGLAMLEPREMK